MLNYPKLPESERLPRMDPPKGKVRMVLDTDTYNEIDDQFAVVYSLLSPESMQVEAIHAAPFWNNNSEGPADGMEKSYEEILRLLERLNVSPEGFVFRGSTGFLTNNAPPYDTEASRDLIRRALETPEDDPLYVVAIGAITNVASAILLEPSIINRIVVVWLGGNPWHWPNTHEFNLAQDIPAARVIFDSGVPLVQVPCLGVASHLLTTLAELERHVKGQGPIGDYLYQIFADYHADHFAWAKEIWDISAVAWLINSAWLHSELVHSPIVTDQKTYSLDQGRHFIRMVRMINRNGIFRDLFEKLAKHGT